VTPKTRNKIKGWRAGLEEGKENGAKEEGKTHLLEFEVCTLISNPLVSNA
jgi:hypothetical protein